MTGTMRPQSSDDGHAEVDVAVVDDVVARDRRVDGGARLQAGDDRLEDEGHVGELRPVLGGEAVLHLLAQLRDGRVVDLEDRGDVGRGRLRLDHPLGDLLAHRRHRLDRDVRAGGEGDDGNGGRGLGGRRPEAGGPPLRPGRPARRGRDGGRGRSRRRRGGRRNCRSGGGSGSAAGLEEGGEVGLRHTPGNPGAGNLRQVDALLLGDVPHDRRGAALLEVFLRLPFLRRGREVGGRRGGRGRGRRRHDEGRRGRSRGGDGRGPRRREPRPRERAGLRPPQPARSPSPRPPRRSSRRRC